MFCYQVLRADEGIIFGNWIEFLMLNFVYKVDLVVLTNVILAPLIKYIGPIDCDLNPFSIFNHNGQNFVFNSSFFAIELNEYLKSIN